MEHLRFFFLVDCSTQIQSIAIDVQHSLALLFLSLHRKVNQKFNEFLAHLHKKMQQQIKKKESIVHCGWMIMLESSRVELSWGARTMWTRHETVHSLSFHAARQRAHTYRWIFMYIIPMGKSNGSKTAWYNWIVTTIIAIIIIIIIIIQRRCHPCCCCCRPLHLYHRVSIVWMLFASVL